MRVYFESSGGLAGMYRSATIDTDSGNPEDEIKLRDLITDSDFFNLPSESPRPKPGSADYLHYKITVESEGLSHTVSTNDTTLPPRLFPLISFLQSKAKIGRHPSK
jgi:hypothetical protein